MDKFQVAHEYAMQYMQSKFHLETKEELIALSWEYADSMQDEADKRKEKGVPDVLKVSNSTPLDWQPDWDKIPDGFDWWAMDKKGKAHCFDREPVIDSSEWVMASSNTNYQSSLTFDYQGDWRNSLRKRPQ